MKIDQIEVESYVGGIATTSTVDGEKALMLAAALSPEDYPDNIARRPNNVSSVHLIRLLVPVAISVENEG